MTQQRFQKIRLTFETLVGLPPELRSSRLNATRQTDPDLAREVEELFSAYSRRAGFIETPITSLRQEDMPCNAAGTFLTNGAGTYRLVEQLGEGGMGEVWKAEQDTPVRRTVAIKLIKPGMNSRELVQRFESERQALALMEHPAISKIFDAGTTYDGRPFFAMELVEGLPIHTYCTKNSLRTRERIQLFLRVCEGVQHAHQRTVLHRDLKPSNILVVEVDGIAQPKIIDFGVARALGDKLTADTMITRAGAILGTPDYMSPEQANSNGEDVDTRTDVYSLGVILYELLTGSRPFQFQGVGLEERFRILREVDAERPSARVRGPAKEEQRLSRQLRGDLDAICLKAIEKDPARRYRSPAELQEDLQRYLRSEPVQARPADFAYEARKFVRRHRAPVSLTALALLIVVCFTVAQSIQLRRITRERDRADRVTRFMTDMFRVSDPGESLGNRITAREILDKASATIGAGLASDPEMQAQMMDVMGTVYYKLGLFKKSEDLLDKSLQIRRRVLGLRHTDTASSLSNLARAKAAAGNRAEAEKLDQQALGIREALLGPEDPQTLSSLHNIAVGHWQSSRYAEAEALYRKVLALRRKVLGPEHPDTLNSLDNLGDTLGALGRFPESEAIEREVVSIKRRVLGAEHPETLRAMHHLANTLYDEGRAQEAADLDRELLNARERILGFNHRDTWNAMLALANSLDDLGRFKEAEDLNRRAMNAEAELLGVNHPDTLLALNNLGEIVGDLGNYKEAERLLRMAVQRREAVQGREHAYALSSRDRLAYILILQGKVDEAEKISSETREIQSRKFGPGYPNTAEATYNLACIAARKGRVDQALAMLRTSIEQGLRPRLILRTDSDPSLASIRNDPRFCKLLRETPGVVWTGRHWCLAR